jgi:hypothetical protein
VFRRGTGGSDFNAAYTSGWILNNGIWQAQASMRSPIFYDSDDTARFFNGAGGINFLTGSSNRVTIYSDDSGFYVSNGEGSGITARLGAAYGLNGIYVNPSLYLQSENTIFFRTQNVQRASLDSSGILTVSGDVRAPIFYDSNNTGYYANPATTSEMYRINANDKFYARGNVGVDECCGSDATISVGGTSTRPPSISWHYSGVMQGNMQGNQTGWRKIYFYDDQGSGLGVHATGQIASNADVIAYYSDKRLKKDLVRVVDHWNVINNLNGYRFTWNEKSGEIPGFRDKVGKREVGLIAQDVQAVYPEAIAMRTEGPEEDPYMTIKHDRFTAVFIEALKDLRVELDEVKEENKRLREMINGQ